MHKLTTSLATALSLALLLTAALFAVPAYALTGGEDTIKIPVSVTTQGQGIPGETYTVKIEPVGDAPAVENDKVLFDGTELKAGTFQGELNLSFANASVGEYSYRVYQVTPQDSTGRASYDTAVYNLKVTFEHPEGDMSKTDVVASIRKAGDAEDVKYDSCAFTNTYANLPAGVSDPPVTKRITGDSPAQKSTFTFVFEGVDGAPMPEGAVDGKIQATIDGEGTVEFGESHYTQAGTYVYRCYEVKDSVEGYTYDDTVYTVRVVVTEGVSGFNVQRSVEDANGNYSPDIVFTNDYKAPATPVTPSDLANTGDTTNLVVVALIACAGVVLAFGAHKMSHMKQDDEQKSQN